MSVLSIVRQLVRPNSLPLLCNKHLYTSPVSLAKVPTILQGSRARGEDLSITALGSNDGAGVCDAWYIFSRVF